MTLRRLGVRPGTRRTPRSGFGGHATSVRHRVRFRVLADGGSRLFQRLFGVKAQCRLSPVHPFHRSRHDHRRRQVGHRTAVDTTKSVAFPRRGGGVPVEVIEHFETSAPFTDHDRAPFSVPALTRVDGCWAVQPSVPARGTPCCKTASAAISRCSCTSASGSVASPMMLHRHRPR